MSNKIQKVIIITNIPNPYRIPLFNELNEQLKRMGIELKVIFGSQGYPRRKFKLDMKECRFDYRILKPLPHKLLFTGRAPFMYRGLLKALKKEQVDKIITIGFSLATVKLWLRSFWNKTPIIIWCGTIPTSKLSLTRAFLRRIIIKRVSGFVAYGSMARRYLISLGADPKKIHVAINTVDTDFFYRKTSELRLGLKRRENKKHLTYIGYFVPRKNVFRVLEVVKLLSHTRNDFMLDLIGDGPDRDKLEKFVQGNGISDLVKFHGFKQKHELPEFLARSHCFLFQTDFDIWGLVLNEAMAAGVPCISSIHAGSPHDLIIEGETGFALDFANTKNVVDRVNWLLDHPKEARRLGDNAGQFIQEHATLGKSVEGFIKAINQ